MGNNENADKVVFEYNKQLNKSMEIIFEDIKCKDCENLNFYDWYFCIEGKHCDKNGFIKEKPLKQCKFYKKCDKKFWIEEMSKEEYDRIYGKKNE